ncbi:MAG TPA: hypothetical protein VHF58_05695, partial [Solirubrobacterales bacterium]|nr:hypothetical protein [Solirubrobacterales bacterium]
MPALSTPKTRTFTKSRAIVSIPGQPAKQSFSPGLASGATRTIGLVARSSSVYVCQSCGNESLAWSGRCNGCGEWNTLVE